MKPTELLKTVKVTLVKIESKYISAITIWMFLRNELESLKLYRQLPLKFRVGLNKNQ